MIRTIFFAIVAIISFIAAIYFSANDIEYAGLKSFIAFTITVFSTFMSGLIYESFKKDRKFSDIASYHFSRN